MPFAGGSVRDPPLLWQLVQSWARAFGSTEPQIDSDSGREGAESEGGSPLRSREARSCGTTNEWLVHWMSRSPPSVWMQSHRTAPKGQAARASHFNGSAAFGPSANMVWISELLEVPARAPLAARGTPGGEMERMHSQLRSMVAGASRAKQ